MISAMVTVEAYAPFSAVSTAFRVSISLVDLNYLGIDPESTISFLTFRPLEVAK
jgi:hypothetical protein